jgi:hypothetical protein
VSKTLLTLIEDAEADVRDWATFRVGVLGDQDSIELRASLRRRLNDSNTEAAVGLAKWNDSGVSAKAD